MLERLSQQYKTRESKEGHRRGHSRIITRNSPEASVRRRHITLHGMPSRDKTTYNHHPKMMTQDESKAWKEARKVFGEAVASAMQDLLRQGFCRERATSVILQKIDSGGKHDKPRFSDEQVSLASDCTSISSEEFRYCRLSSDVRSRR